MTRKKTNKAFELAVNAMFHKHFSYVQLPMSALGSVLAQCREACISGNEKPLIVCAARYSFTIGAA